MYNCIVYCNNICYHDYRQYVPFCGLSELVGLVFVFVQAKTVRLYRIHSIRYALLHKVMKLQSCISLLFTYTILYNSLTVCITICGLV